MMKVCGVDLKANEAILTVLSLDDGLFSVQDLRARKLMLPKAEEAESVRKFQFDFAKLLEDYKIENVVIRGRAMKGKFAGGAVSFKMEAAIQLIENINVLTLQPTEIKTLIKRNPLPIDFADTELKGFQKDAFMTAYAHLMGVTYKHIDEEEGINEDSDVWANHR